MSRQKDIRRHPHVDGELVDLTRSHHDLPIQSLPETRPYDAIAENNGPAIREDIAEAGHDVRVNRIRSDVEDGPDIPDHLQRLLQPVAGEDEDVIAPLDGLMIRGTRRHPPPSVGTGSAGLYK